jgi:ribosomal protein S18 acetylase RimI-like enzyme
MSYIKPKITLCDIEDSVQFLIKNPHINTQYSDMFNEYFPHVKKPFYKSLDELQLHERIFREKMLPTLININNESMFDMKKYYHYLKDVLPSYNIENLYIIFLINDYSRDRLKTGNNISVNDQLIGCATISKHTNKIDLMITDVCIRKEYQGKGYGKILTKLSIDLAKKLANKLTYNKISLSVGKTNKKAISCYKTVGFKIISENYRKKDILMEYILK